MSTYKYVNFSKKSIFTEIGIITCAKPLAANQTVKKKSADLV